MLFIVFIVLEIIFKIKEKKRKIKEEYLIKKIEEKNETKVYLINELNKEYEKKLKGKI